MSCAATPDQAPISVDTSALGGGGHDHDHHGSAPMACTPRDTADTTCDGVDDDCDGVLDEDCAFGPANCPIGYNVIAGTSRGDMLVGTGGRDCILGYGGNDVIFGLGGNDILVGGQGDDFIGGGAGDDVINGGAGDDQLSGGDGRDSIDGGDGNDVINGADGGDTIHGGACHDVIWGSNGTDNLFGDGGSDRIRDGRSNHVDGGDGIDACDGTHCELSSTSRACTRDADCSSGKRCVVPTGICASPSVVPFNDVTCDGVDDDCDGKVDENYVPVAVTCGSCGGMGMTSCVNGHVQNSCPPSTGGGGSGSSDPTCDGVDDDCDGRVDEDFVGSTTSCGVGACSATGTSVCVAGHVQSGCTAGTPGSSDASCDGIDNNCNGSVDEGFVATATQCGVGACHSMGSTSCVSGTVQDTCMAGVPAPSDATCDGVDDNCNGANDEDFIGAATTCGVGACLRAGSSVCVNGAVQSTCAPGTPAASDATCDGVDDNCNGAVDEGFVSVATTCGVGACLRSGSSSCVNGAVQNNCTPGAPAPSDATCDNVDDNCNGAVDEGFPTTVTTCGVGACLRSGGQSCVNGSVQNSCVAGTPAPFDSTCDGVDDNCNGVPDEGFVSVVTTCGVGGCVRSGSTSCSGGVVHNSCVPGTPAPSDVSCDGVDDNCNGATDEGFVSAGTTCGIGACASTGSTSCSGGTVHDNCTPGTPAPSDATCDGIDDNCNGTNDENYASVFMTCGLGACVRSGSTSCVGGAVQNNCTPGTPGPSDVTCNGVDENCNGVADEGFVPTCSGTTANTCVNGAPHSTQCADTDACNGQESCSAGTCAAGTPPVTDDANPCTADSCDPLLGVRHTPVASGTSCEDGNVCNGAEQCLPVAGCLTPASGAVSWWPGDGNPTDVIGGQDGTLTNGLGFASGEVAQAFNYDGVDDFLGLSSHAAALNLAGQATIEMWVKISEDTCRTVFDLRQDSTHEQFLQVGNGCTAGLTNELVTWTYNNGATTAQVGFTTTSRTILIDGRFHHLALTFDGRATSIFIDGGVRTVSTATGAVNNGVWGNFASPTVASLGGAAGSPAQSFKGVMDEVTLYDHALLGTQIMSIVSAGAKGKCKAPTCTAGSNAPVGTACGSGGSCDGAGVCGP